MAEFDREGKGRSYPRETVRYKVALQVDGWWHDCVITNASRTGARLYIRQNLEPETMVDIQAGSHGEFKAKVIWCKDNEAGVNFDPLPEEMEAALLQLSS